MRWVSAVNSMVLMCGILIGLDGTHAFAGFDEGIEAYQEGAFAVALGEFRPLDAEGDATAQYSLGVMYRNGEGVARDDQQAVEWYRRAAVQGHAMAESSLGFMYWMGNGVARNDVKATDWFRKAAKQGDAAAQYNLGHAYWDGRGVPQDDKLAEQWIRMAAAQGYASAQSDLGVMYEEGKVLPQDDKQALAWYRKAAVQGHARAQSNLGAMYLHGRGVTRNAVIAFALFSVAEGNFEIAASNRTAVARVLTPEQIAEGEALSRQLAHEDSFLVVLDAATERVPSSAGR